MHVIFGHAVEGQILLAGCRAKLHFFLHITI